MYLKKSELNALHEALDYISSSTDGVDDVEYWHNLHSELHSIYEKGINEYYARQSRRIVKKAISKAMINKNNRNGKR